MGKHDEKDDKKRKKKDLERKESNHRTTASNATYVDGHPLDEIQYLEAKLILKPDRFTSVESFRDFGKIVKRAAKETDVDFIPDPQSGLRPDIREILFFDTPDFRLYNNAFILRRRISYVDGFPVGDPEIVFKYRHPDEKAAAAIDVRPKIAGKYRIKFKAEALPLKDHIGSYRILYSHNCQFGISQVHEADPASLLTLTRVFPALGVLKHSPEERISLVSEAIVEEGAAQARRARLWQGPGGQMRRGLVADARRAQTLGRRVCLSGQIRTAGRCSRKGEEARRAILHYLAAGCGRMAFSGHHENRHGLSPERQRPAKP